MSSPFHKPRLGLREDGTFSFFPARQKEDLPGEGREPHEVVKTDLASRREPTERQIGIVLFVAALLLYLATLSWVPFPGLPSFNLRLHLGLDIRPATNDLLWGVLVRLFARLPGLSAAGWTAVFSAICGAASVSLLGRLMSRVGYFIRNEPGPMSFNREAQARRLSGWVAGIYLACCIPFWMSATRTLPGAFHLFLLLQTAWFFSEYQHWGLRRHLGLVGLFYGIGITEFATFIVFLPAAIFLVCREMFRWRALRSWQSQMVVWGGLLLGLLLYPLQAYALFHRGAETELIHSFWAAWGLILQQQGLLITDIRFHPGFPVIMFFSLVPWLILFAASCRSPWFYERGQVAVRLIFVAGFLGISYNMTYSPWNLLGMDYLMLTPYVLLAGSMGYMAGEFWILGEIQQLLDYSWRARLRRHLSSALALVLPLAILGGGVSSWRKADGRTSRILDTTATDILNRLEGRDILFTVGILDDALCLAAWEQQRPVHLVSIGRASSPIYLRKLARGFDDPELKQALTRLDFGAFLEILLLSAQGAERTGIIDMPDLFREFGYLVPDGFIYRLEADREHDDLPRLVESQRPFWDRMIQMQKKPAPPGNLVRPYQDLLLMLASKTANNLGVLLAEREYRAGAVEAFRAARSINPENLSALLNLLELGRTQDLPEAEVLQAEGEELEKHPPAGRWELSFKHGYVWHAYEWAARGQAWVLSGTPTAVEAARRTPTVETEEADDLARLLDQAYMTWGVSVGDEITYRARLVKDSRDTAALMGLCRLALRRMDLLAADAYMAEAVAMGFPAENTEFDRAMADYVRGEKAQALARLETLTNLTPADMRVWVAIVLIGDPHDPLSMLAIKTLKKMEAADIASHLALASAYITLQEWADAQAELEKILQLDPNSTEAWEMMVSVAQAQGNTALMGTSMNALLAKTPDHFMRYQNEGVQYYKRGNLEKAEAAFRKGIEQRRDPALLNNLAYVILERKGNLQEALGFVDEALKRRPGLTDLYGTRAEIYLQLGRFADARADLHYYLKRQSRNYQMILLLALSYEGLGDRERAWAVATTLARQPDKLNAEQKKKLRELLKRLR